MNPEETSINCVAFSLTANEALYGSANQALVWFLLAYNHPWGAKALEESSIPQAVQARLSSYPDSNTLLIRQPGRASAQDALISFYVVNALEAKQYRFELPHWEALLALDLEAIVAGHADPWDAPVYAICANGKRDVCCAQYGVPLYNAMVPHAGEAVWQCTHIGGHRFAGTMIQFPEGLCYGRLDAADVQAILGAQLRHEVLLEHLRGRVTLPSREQAAEYFLRMHLGLRHFDGLRYLDSAETPDAWSIRFTTDEGQYAVQLAAAEPVAIQASTNDSKLKQIEQFRLLEIQSL